jgi:hypothetical protein
MKMQDNNRDISSQSDAFNMGVRHKLENHQLPVDENVWAEIEARMNAGKRKKIVPFWWWFSGGAAVAMLALMFTLLPVHESTSNIARNSQKSSKVKLGLVKDKVLSLRAGVTLHTTKLQSDSRLNNERAVSDKQVEDKEQIVPIAEKHVEALAVGFDSVVDNSAIVADEIISSPGVNDSAGLRNKEKYTITSLVAKNADYTAPEAKTKNEWLIAAAIGSGGGASLSGSTNPLYAADFGNKNIMSAQTSYTNILNPNDFSEKNFMAPLSFGLIVRKSLTQSLSVESGLVYTYLLSTFSLSSFANYDASLKLHYLGIPVNLVARIWKVGNWELYASGGVMVEKGLQSVYVQNQRTDYQTITTIAKTSIDGMQWSLNTGLGATYKIQRNVGIYFEPKFSYFFDNNQPVSVRTEQAVVVGLTAGLRFQF